MLALVACSVSLLAGGATPLVDSGQAKAVLVIARQPTPVARYAAQELAYHVRKATGVKLDMPVDLLRTSLRRSLAEVEQCLGS